MKLNRKTLLVVALLLVAGYFLVKHTGTSTAANGSATGSQDGQPVQSSSPADAGQAASGDDAIAALLAALGNQNGQLEQQLLSQINSFNTGANYGTQTSGSTGGGGFTFADTSSSTSTAPIAGSDGGVHSTDPGSPTQILTSGYNPYTDPMAINASHTGNAETPPTQAPSTSGVKTNTFA